MSDNSPDGKPWMRSTDAINVSMSQATMTQLSQLESSSQVGACETYAVLPMSKSYSTGQACCKVQMPTAALQ